MAIIDLPLPASRNYSTRIEWAGDRYADIADGTIADREVAWLVWNIVQGWSDLGTQEERDGYRRMAGQIAQLNRATWPSDDED